MASSALIQVRNLHLVYTTLRGDLIHALANISVEIRERELVTVVGPSGCGKTTLLRILAGLLPATRGEVQLAGTAVVGPRGDIGVVFQNPILLPWRTVLSNVLLPAEVLELPRGAARARAAELLRTVRLAGFEDKYPMELSGGMQQRAAIARALLHDPAILLMDEPFGSLDAMTREQMNLELQRIWQESQKTIVLITHSIPEAVFLGDRVVVMTPRPGMLARVIAVDIPRPRGLDVMASPAFGAIARDIRDLLHQRGAMD
jgi:NitT/TauT family transport system ATP-binding protein